MATLYQQKQQIIDACHSVYNKGWVAANDGNLSIRLDKDRVLCTPTGMSKGLLTPEDLVVIDMEANKVEGRPDRKPSTEMKVHLMCYEEREDVNAVVHAHPPYATGYALAGLDLGECKLPEVVISLGTIPLTKYALPGTDDLPDAIREWVHQSDAFLMELHGVVTIGADLQNAYFKMETTEHFAHIDFIARNLGGAKVFSREQAEDLLEARARYGVTTPNMGCRAEDGYALPPGMGLDDVPPDLRHAADSAQPATTMNESDIVEEVTRRVMQALRNS
jgi:L-fuculose-phosphate aldolase